jgi:hypothetical protein
MKLISNGCPKCVILEGKLKEKGIIYEKSSDIQEIINAGFKTIPMLNVNGEYLDFGKALKWIQDM